MAHRDTKTHFNMKLIKKQFKMSLLEMISFGAIVLLTIWLLQNLPDIFRSLKNLF